MSNLSDVLKQRRKALKLTLAQIADMMGVAEATVQRWESGNIKSVRYDKITKLAEILRVPPAHLMGWEESDIFSTPGILPVKTKRIPLLGNVSCGEPIFASEETGMFVESDESIHADFCLRATGDSMIGARIFDGDLVFVHKQDMVNNGEIAVVLIGDETTLKRVQYDAEHGELALFAENPAYKTMRFRGEELNGIRILGKAVVSQTQIV